jgi:Uma2 family endonuclease
MGFRVRKNPDSIVGIDAALASINTPVVRLGRREILDGPPLLAIEITSLSDRQEDVDGKVEEYLRVNIPLVWIVNPTLKTIAVYRPDAEPQLFTLSSEMTAEPHLPGLRFKVADVFAKMPSFDEETHG